MRIPLWVSLFCILAIGITGIASIFTNKVFASPGTSSHPIGSTIAIYDPGLILSNESTHTQNPANAGPDQLAWSPDGKFITYSDNGSLDMWNIATGKQAFRCCQDPIEDDNIRTIAWSPDGRWIATGDDGGRVNIWDVTTKKLITSYTGAECEGSSPPACTVSSVAWSPDGKEVVSGSCDEEGFDPQAFVAIQIHNATTGKLIVSYRGHSGCVENISWPHNSHTIISNASDGPGLPGAPAKPALQVWDASTGKTLFQYSDRQQRSITALASPDGKYIVIMSIDQNVIILNASTYKPLFSYTIPVSPDSERIAPSMLWSADSTRLVSNYEGFLHVWNATTGNEITIYNDPVNYHCCDGPGQLTWSPDGIQIAFVTSESMILIWQASPGLSHLSLQELFIQPLMLLSGGGIILIMFIAMILLFCFRVTLQRWKPSVIIGATLLTVIGFTCLPIALNTWPTSASSTIPRGTTFHAFDGDTMAWSPDSQRLVTGLVDGTIYIWNPDTGERIITTHARFSNVTTLAWSPDGAHIAAGYADGTIQILDASTGRVIYTYIRHVNGITEVAWSPDNIHIASASAPDHVIYVWQASGTPGKTIAKHEGTAFNWSPDGSRIASADGANTVHIWQASTGKDVLLYHSKAVQVTSVAWSPDGASLASGNDNGFVDIWAANTGKLHFSYNGLGQPVQALAWSPDGTQIAAGADIIHIMDASSGHHVFPYLVGATTLAWSSDGTRIASASFIVSVWEATQSSTPKEVSPALPANVLIAGGLFIIFCLLLCILFFLFQKITINKLFIRFILIISLFCLCFASVFDASTFTMHISQIPHDRASQRDATTQPLLLYQYLGEHAALSPDGKYLAAAWGTPLAQIWDLSTGDLILTYRNYPAKVYGLAWSPDGTKIAAGYDDGTIRIWDVHTARDLLNFSTHQTTIIKVAWSPDGTRLLSMSNLSQVSVWSTSTGQILLNLRVDVNDVSLSPDGTRIALIGVISTNYGAEILDARTGQVLVTYPEQNVVALAWSPDSKTVALALNGKIADQVIQEWDVTRPALRRTVPIPPFGLLAWSPDGKYLFTGKGVCDATTGQILTTLPLVPMPYLEASWSANSREILAWNGIIDVWQLPTNL